MQDINNQLLLALFSEKSMFSASALCGQRASSFYVLLVGQLTKTPRTEECLLRTGLIKTFSMILAANTAQFAAIGPPTSPADAAREAAGSPLSASPTLLPGAGQLLVLLAKLVLAALHYTDPQASARVLLERALCSTSESVRLYATRFMRVLFRCRLQYLAHWALEYLLRQLADCSLAIRTEALQVLFEACEDPVRIPHALYCSFIDSI